MEQCKICNNKEQCEKWHWVVTMDKGYKIDKPFEEFMCDNFITNETIQFHKVESEMKYRKIDKCLCGSDAKIIGYFIKGIANHKNYFVKCENCKLRTRKRKTPYKAIEEWNEYKGNLFLKERKIRDD